MSTALAAAVAALAAVRFMSAAAPALPHPGQPVATAGSVVTLGQARFTVLTPALLRLEWGNTLSGDVQTTVVWNRALPVPAFTVEWPNASTPGGGGLRITTEAVNLTYLGDGSAPFSDADLSIALLRPTFNSVQAGGGASPVWVPSMRPALDEGNLGGTFHTLDTIGGWPGLNCSVLDPLFEQINTIPFYPCVSGLVSKNGWSVLDDSRSPVMTEDWLAPRRDGVCDAGGARTACIPGMWNLASQSACEGGGCCYAYDPPPPLLLNLYYSATREDHFTDSSCAGCDGAGYVLERPQGLVLSDASLPGTIPLNLYWNSNPSAASGPGGDNVVSTIPPSQAGYTFVRVQGWIFNTTAEGGGPPAASTHAVKLWYSAAKLDHFTTMTDADEAEATGGGYTLVATLGSVYTPNATLPPSPGPSCFARTQSSDVYFFGHGMHYAEAVRDFVAVAGPVPIPRRAWLGMSWSRWGNEIVQSVMYEEVQNLTAAGFPLSTYILDMNWHEKPGWTGYSWDEEAYPNHTAMLAWMRGLGLTTAVNLHDADGVGAFERSYAAMAAANGVDPSTNATILFNITDKTYADSLHDLVLQPLTDEGVDFQWTDWQQGLPGVAGVPGVTPAWVLNHYRFQNFSALGSTSRGITHSRFPGWGGHRYPSGFGGDVLQEWTSLAFMVYFTTTATNVAFCWWGHEMMRAGGSPDDNTELFTRVMQFGSWSPVYTNWGNSGEDDDLWRMDSSSLHATRAALVDRARTLPLRYTLAKSAFDTGLGPLRPMYYRWPSIPDSYTALTQYMLGDEVLVAPVTSAGDAGSGLARVPVWFPPGTAWVDWNAPGVAYRGGGPGNGTTLTLSYPLALVPVFVAAGAVLPLTPRALATPVGAAAGQYTALQFSVFPSVGASGAPVFPPPPGTVGSTWVYEDDGVSNGYLPEAGGGGRQRGHGHGTWAGEGEGRTSGADAWANTTVSYAVGGGGGPCLSFNITTAGAYPSLPVVRQYSVWLLASTLAPASVSAEGGTVVVPQSAEDCVPGTWWRDAAAGSAPVDTRIYMQPGLATARPHSLEVCW